MVIVWVLLFDVLLLVLDDVFLVVDIGIEMVIFEYLCELCVVCFDCSVIVIVYWLLVVMDVDEVIVLCYGYVIE